MGFVGYFAGPDVHLVDPMGLTDPLLARLPIWFEGHVLTPQKAIPPELEWRIGHFVRPLPEGYLETLETGENRLASKALASYWDELARITRGELWSGERLSTILRWNLRGADPRIERYLRGE
jgi:arabinofuranosyltransferase